MPVLTFDSQDAIPEPLRDLSVEQDGKWVASIVPERDVAGLRESQRKLLDEKKKATDSLNALLSGRSLDEVKAILAKQQDDADKAGADKTADPARWAEREKKLREEMDAKLAPLVEKAKKLEQKEFEDAVWEAARAAGALDSDRKLVLKAAKDDYVTRDPNTGKIVVLDEYGEPSGDDLKSLFEGRFKKENAKLYAAQGGSGGGANGGGSSAGRGRSTAVADNMADFVARVTSDKDALQQAKSGKLTVRA